jgi:hypothetical protein
MTSMSILSTPVRMTTSVMGEIMLQPLRGFASSLSLQVLQRLYFSERRFNNFQGDGVGLINLFERLRTTKSSSITGPDCPPAVMYVQPYVTCGNRRHDCEDRCPEEEIRAWSGRGAPFWWCDAFWGGGEKNAFNARAAGLPVASYRDAVWPVQGEMPADFPWFWYVEGQGGGVALVVRQCAVNSFLCHGSSTGMAPTIITPLSQPTKSMLMSCAILSAGFYFTRCVLKGTCKLHCRLRLLLD